MRYRSVCTGIAAETVAWAPLGWETLSFSEIELFCCALLGALAECGYGFAYRVFDAQFDGLAQRRQRVFVVGYLGDWRPSAAVLFERESLRRDTAPRREAGEEVAGTIGGCAGEGGPRNDLDNHGGAYVSMALNAHGGSGRLDGESETFVACPLTSNPYGDHESRESLLVTHTLSANGFDASEDGTGRGSPLVVETLRSHPRPGSNTTGALATMTGTLSGANGGGMPDPSRLNTYAGYGVAVRRLTPKEWERLQGLEDDYTAITYRGKPAADGPRYKAIGNSISVPTLAWIGRRINTVDKLLRKYVTP